MEINDFILDDLKHLLGPDYADLTVLFLCSYVKYRFISYFCTELLDNVIQDILTICASIYLPYYPK